MPALLMQPAEARLGAVQPRQRAPGREREGRRREEHLAVEGDSEVTGLDAGVRAAGLGTAGNGCARARAAAAQRGTLTTMVGQAA